MTENEGMPGVSNPVAGQTAPPPEILDQITEGANALVVLMAYRGMTILEMYVETGLSTAFIGGLLRGEVLATGQTIQLLADTLGVSAGVLESLTEK